MQEFYYQLTLTVDNQKEAILNYLTEIYQDAIEELENSYILRSEDNLDKVEKATLEFSKNLSKALNEEIKIDSTLEKLKNIDWIQSYQDSISPIEVDKFYIHPSWYSPKENSINITINPSLAFGSGHHESTSSSLLLISKYLKQNSNLLDVGCGSGILAIAGAKLGAKVDICDSDELAIKSAKENFKLNSEEFNRAWVGSANLSNQKYDFVVANIVADVLILISKDLKSRLKDEGVLILSGILSKSIERVVNKFKDLKLLEIIEKGEWVTLSLKKEIDAK